VAHTTGQAQVVVKELFAAYLSVPAELPERYQRRIGQAQALAGGVDEQRATARVVADYIAGMTDRFALREHERLTGKRLLS